MSDYKVQSKYQAEFILKKFTECGSCSECPLNEEGWRCSYLAEQAKKYLKNYAELEEKKYVEIFDGYVCAIGGYKCCKKELINGLHPCCECEHCTSMEDAWLEEQEL